MPKTKCSYRASNGLCRLDGTACDVPSSIQCINWWNRQENNIGFVLDPDGSPVPEFRVRLRSRVIYADLDRPHGEYSGYVQRIVVGKRISDDVFEWQDVDETTEKSANVLLNVRNPNDGRTVLVSATRVTWVVPD